MNIDKQKTWPSLILALLALGAGATQANSEGLTPHKSGEIGSYSLKTAIARADPQQSWTGRIAVLEQIVLTDDGVIISVDGQQLSAKPDLNVDGDRISITLQGMELASSISIQSQNTLPEASLLKRRLKVRQVEKNVVEISLSTGSQDWTVTPHAQGLFLVPTAIAQSQSGMQTISQSQPSPEARETIATAEIIEDQSTVAEEKIQKEFIAQQIQTPTNSFQTIEKPTANNIAEIISQTEEVEIFTGEIPESEPESVKVVHNDSQKIVRDTDRDLTTVADENQTTPTIEVANLPSFEIGSSDLGKAPLIIAQSFSDTPQPTLEELKEQLLIPPVPPGDLARRYFPTLTYGVPSAFGPAWGDLYISATGATAGDDRDGQVDGSISMGFGLGDPVENVGLNFAYNIGSINNFGQNGTFDMSASRIVYADPITTVAVAAGWSDFAQYGNEAVTPSTVWGTVTSYSFLRPDDPVNKLPLLLSLGAGGGYFRQDPASTGVFGGVGLQIAPQVGVGLQWSGVGLNLGLSFVPVPTIPLVLTATGADLTGNSPGGTRFVLSLSYGFNFLPTPGANGPR